MGELIVNSWGRGGSRGIVDPVADLLDGVAVVTAAEPPPTGHAGGVAAAEPRHGGPGCWGVAGGRGRGGSRGIVDPVAGACRGGVAGLDGGWGDFYCLRRKGLLAIEASCLKRLYQPGWAGGVSLGMCPPGRLMLKGSLLGLMVLSLLLGDVVGLRGCGFLAMPRQDVIKAQRDAQ